jgi:hypothetical protein
MRFHRPIEVGVLLIPLALTSAMALAQGSRRSEERTSFCGRFRQCI